MWRLWMSIKQRCYNPNNKDYERYGGRGITMDAEWLNFNKFFADMGKMPAGKCLDRIDNDKPYSKANCRWSTMTEQSNNRKGNVRVEFNGLNLTYAEWDRQLGLSHGCTRQRLAVCGWSKEKALTKL